MRSLNGLQRAGDLVHAYGEKQVEIPQRQPSCKKGGKDVKRKCRKLLSLLTALCLVLSMTPLAALAAETDPSGYWTDNAAETYGQAVNETAKTVPAAALPPEGV